MKNLGKTVRLVELYQTKDFEIVFEYKQEACPNPKRLINYELRQKGGHTQSYQGRIDSLFDSLDEVRKFVDEFLDKNFILCPFE